MKGGVFMSDSSLQKAMANVEASINMEGMFVNDVCKELCIKLLKKEITFEEYLRCILLGVENHGV